MEDKGNVVLAFTSQHYLMLDCDMKREVEVKRFAKKYAKFQNLGSAVVFRSSDTPQIDLFGKKLGNYCVIFGRPISWDEVEWHINQVYCLKMVNKGFTKMRWTGSITIRVSAKNKKIPHPRPISYFSNEDDTGVMEFLDYWIMCRNMGRESRNDKA